MNGSQEHPDVPTQRPTRPVAPPPASPVQTAPPQPAASYAVPATAAGRAQRLQHKFPFIACALSLLPGLRRVLQARLHPQRRVRVHDHAPDNRSP